ncbi:MAG: A24 family peptidase [Corynebacterium sp.]|nr:A24 family peptidase [Corynebacterium sp.]
MHVALAILGVGWAGVLSWWDLRHRRLPNLLVLPVAAGAVIAALLWHPAALLGLLWPLLYTIVPGIGGGDVKLAIPLGIATWWIHPLATCASIGLASIVSLLAALITRQRSVPHGPAMLLAAALAVGLWRWM